MSELPDEANAVHCRLDCGAVYRGAVECQEDPLGHVTEDVYVTDSALGLPNDQDYWHFGMRTYVYDMGELEAAKEGL